MEHYGTLWLHTDNDDDDDDIHIHINTAIQKIKSKIVAPEINFRHFSYERIGGGEYHCCNLSVFASTHRVPNQNM